MRHFLYFETLISVFVPFAVVCSMCCCSAKICFILFHVLYISCCKLNKFCTFFLEICCSWWLKLSEKSREKRINCIRIHVLSPFLFGVVPPGQEDKVILIVLILLLYRVWDWSILFLTTLKFLNWFYLTKDDRLVIWVWFTSRQRYPVSIYFLFQCNECIAAIIIVTSRSTFTVRLFCFLWKSTIMTVKASLLLLLSNFYWL